MGIFRNDKFVDPKDLHETAEGWATDEKRWSEEKAKNVANRYMRIWRKRQKRIQSGT